PAPTSSPAALLAVLLLRNRPNLEKPSEQAENQPNSAWCRARVSDALPRGWDVPAGHKHRQRNSGATRIPCEFCMNPRPHPSLHDSPAPPVVASIPAPQRQGWLVLESSS